MTAVVSPVEPTVPASFVRRREATRRRTVLAIALTCTGAMFFIDVLLGWYTVSLPDFIRIVGGETIPGASFIVMDHRLPRAVTALFVGIAFGISGLTFQTVLRNPLASPDIVGITAGASASAVFALVILDWSGALISAAAFAGALTVATIVYVLAHRRGPAAQQLVVTGVAVAALLYALTSHLLTRADIWTASEALVWLSGSLNNSDWGGVTRLGVALLALVPAAAAAARRLGPLELGDDTATALGVPAARARTTLLLTATALTAVGTAAAGPVAFVSFLAGPISRRLMRGQASLAAAALVGALTVLTADFAAANLLPDVALPVGIVTGAIGAPFLLYLLITTNRVGKGA